jgi:hypothetical protein
MTGEPDADCSATRLDSLALLAIDAAIARQRSRENERAEAAT